MSILNTTPQGDWVVCIDTLDLSIPASTEFATPLEFELAEEVTVLPRTPLLEQSCRYKQLVVYVVLTQRDTNGVGRTMVYQRRGKQEGEQRLAGKFSIGVGGHVEVRDFMPDMRAVDTARPRVDADNLGEACFNAAMRELDEELRWPDDDHPDLANFTEMVARLYTPQDQVGRAHIGIVFRCDLPDNHERPVFGPGDQTLWLSDEDLVAFDLNSCETWTRVLLLQDYDQGLRESDTEPTLAELLAAGAAAESNPAG
jgi:predicted NUDIX family phosphoesterase